MQFLRKNRKDAFERITITPSPYQRQNGKWVAMITVKKHQGNETEVARIMSDDEYGAKQDAWRASSHLAQTVSNGR